jgi:hypothetical protein
MFGFTSCGVNVTVMGSFAKQLPAAGSGETDEDTVTLATSDRADGSIGIEQDHPP